MPCQSCGTTHAGEPATCPACGASRVVDGSTASAAGGAAAPTLVTDGGQPPEDESTGGQSTGGQSTGGQSTDGQSADGQSTGGQSSGGQSSSGQSPGGQSTGGQAIDGGQANSGGQATGGQSSGGQSTGGQTTGGQAGGATPTGGGHPTGQGTTIDIGDVVSGLPLKAGTTIGALALLLPYVVVMLASYVPLERDQFGIGAELYATIVGFGPGDRFVRRFVDGTDISALANVRPEDYPSVAAELDAVLDTLRSQPEALLLPLYVLAPLLCYLGGRHLAKKYADDTPLDHARVALTLPLGALPIPLIVGLAFGVEALGGAIILGGIFVPLLFGALGGLTVFAFRDVSWGASKGYGWLAAVLGMLVAVVLIPLPSAFGGMLEFDLAERALFGMTGFLASVNFGIGGGAQGFLMFLLITLLTVGAGFLRVHRSGRSLPTVAVGARLGASVVLGFLAATALLAIFVPYLSLVISLPFGMQGAFAAVLPDVAKYTNIVLLAAVYASLFGAAGGAAAIWHRDRENTQLR